MSLPPERVHVPVMLRECLEIARTVRPEVWVDLTLGQGGHTEAVLMTLWEEHRLPKLALLSDADHEAVSYFIRWVKPRLPGIEMRVMRAWAHEALKAFKEEICGRGTGEVLVLVDLGVSMAHIAFLPGFSFKREGELDMRFQRDRGITARELIESSSEEELAEILRAYGELRNAGKLARAIKSYQAKRGIRTTSDLVRAVREVVPERILHHTLQRTFQALRIAVNDELRALNELVQELLSWEGGLPHVVFLTYHSLERRALKRLKERYSLIQKQRPSRDEVESNPPSRSAILYHFGPP